MVTFLHSESNISSFLLRGQDVAAGILPEVSCFSYSGMSLIICDLTDSASYNFELGRPRTQAKLITHQAAV